ncbi:unnamed protein product [Withania somnifera]
MASPHRPQPRDSDRPPTAIMHQPASPRFPPGTPTDGANRKIAIAVDLSDESAYAVKWSVENYLRQGDAVILLHVRPTSILYGADWGAVDVSIDTTDEKSKQKLEEDYDNFTSTKSNDLAQPLVDANIPFKIRIVKDHDMKERLCLEIERLGLSAVIMGSRGFGASRRNTEGRLGSVSDYCVRHCVCPVIVVRYPDDDGILGKKVAKESEEDTLYHDASDKATDEKVDGIQQIKRVSMECSI